jgi:hypothetical protein
LGPNVSIIAATEIMASSINPITPNQTVKDLDPNPKTLGDTKPDFNMPDFPKSEDMLISQSTTDINPFVKLYEIYDSVTRSKVITQNQKISKEDAFKLEPTNEGRKLANTLLTRKGVGDDFTYTTDVDGWCLAKVNDAMDSVGIPINRKKWAIYSADVMAKNRNYVEVDGKINESDLDKFPIGTIVVAERGGAGAKMPGHIMVKAKESEEELKEQGILKITRENTANWVSDFRHPAVVYPTGYDKIRVFIPVGSDRTVTFKK